MNENKKRWFKRKTYGWGWTPATWEGWVVLAIYLFIMFGFSYINHTEAPDGNLMIGFGFPFIILTPVLIWICYKKGESPKWQWGKRTNDSSK